MASCRRRLCLPAGGDGRRAFVAGVAGANVLARQHGVALRVLELGVDDDLEEVRGGFGVPHRFLRPIDQADALTADDCREALRAGEAIADVEIAAGADLLIIGDMGIGNTTPAAALVGATLGCEPRKSWAEARVSTTIDCDTRLR